MKVAVVGATGLVGRNMLKVLQERKFPVTELIPVASEKSAGLKVEFNGKRIGIVRQVQGEDFVAQRREKKRETHFGNGD